MTLVFGQEKGGWNFTDYKHIATKTFRLR